MVARPDGVHQSGDLHHIEHVLVVVAGGAVGRQGDVSAVFVQIEDRGETAPQLEVAHGIVHDRCARSGDALDVVIGYPHAVGERGVLVKQVVVIQKGDGGLAEELFARQRLQLGLVDVHVEPALVLPGDVHGAPHQIQRAPLRPVRAGQAAQAAIFCPMPLLEEGRQHV